MSSKSSQSGRACLHRHAHTRERERERERERIAALPVVCDIERQLAGKN